MGSRPPPCAGPAPRTSLAPHNFFLPNLMPRPSNSPDAEFSPAASPKVKVTGESLRQMFSLYAYLRPYRGRLVAGLLLLICSSLLGIAFPMLAGRLINSPTHAVANHFIWV